MSFFSSKNAVCLVSALALTAPLCAMTEAPCLAAAKSKKGAKPRSLTPINTTPDLNNQKPLDLEGIKENLEGRLTVAWRPMSTGKSMYCEIHFNLWHDGKYSDIQIWRSSGNPNYDQAAKSCVDQGSYGPFEGLESIEVVAIFKTEVKGADVVVRFPKYQGTSSKVDRIVAAKRAQEINVIKLMLQRIQAAQKVLGPDSPKLSQSINFLANTYAGINDYSSAESAFKWAISIRQKSNGPNSKELAESVSDLGEMYRVRGDFTSAEECFKRVINMTELKPCTELREATYRYAKLCLASKRKEDSDYLFQRVNDLQAGAKLAPLPANMILDASAAPPDAGANKDAAAGSTDKASAATKSADTKDGAKPNDAKDASKPGDAKDTSKSGDAKDTSKSGDAKDATKSGDAKDGTKSSDTKAAPSS
jgi:tetratricopeptide (TPR) repeat protein